MVFHGFWLISMVFQGGFMAFHGGGFMVFHEFWLVSMVFHGLSLVSHGFSKLALWFLVGFHVFLR